MASNEGEVSRLLDQGKDIILKSTPDGLFTIDRALKAEKHSTILASVFVYASSLAIFLVLLLFELRKETVEKDFQIVKLPDGLISDGYTCEGLKTNFDLQAFGPYTGTGPGGKVISAYFDYSANTEECRSAVGDTPCTELYDYMNKNAIGKGMNIFDSYPKICGFGVDTYMNSYSGYFPVGYYDALFGEGAYEKDSSLDSDKLIAKYLDGIKNATAAAKCPGLTIDFATRSRRLSQSLQMSSTMEGDDTTGIQYIYAKENGLNGMSVFMTVFDSTPSAAPTHMPTMPPLSTFLANPAFTVNPGSPTEHAGTDPPPSPPSVPSYVEDCDKALRKVCERATSISAPFACTKKTSTYPTFFEAFGVSYPNTLAYISTMFILVSMGLPILRPPPAEEKKEEQGKKGDNDDGKEKEEGVKNTMSTADFSFEMTEVYENPLAVRAAEGHNHHHHHHRKSKKKKDDVVV